MSPPRGFDGGPSPAQSPTPDSSDESATTKVEFDLEAFHRELRRRNLRVVFWTAVIFNPVYLLWAAFNFFLAPESWGLFFILRLSAVVINSLTAIACFRPNLRKYSWEALWIIAFSYAAFVAAMLPISGNHFSRFIMGFSVVLFGAGVRSVTTNNGIGEKAPANL
jgi:hypothetical protein